MKLNTEDNWRYRQVKNLYFPRNLTVSFLIYSGCSLLVRCWLFSDMNRQVPKLSDIYASSVRFSAESCLCTKKIQNVTPLKVSEARRGVKKATQPDDRFNHEIIFPVKIETDVVLWSKFVKSFYLNDTVIHFVIYKILSVNHLVRRSSLHCFKTFDVTSSLRAWSAFETL